MSILKGPVVAVIFASLSACAAPISASAPAPLPDERQSETASPRAAGAVEERRHHAPGAVTVAVRNPDGSVTETVTNVQPTTGGQ